MRPRSPPAACTVAGVCRVTPFVRTLRRRKPAIALCALVPVLAVGAGCGGGGDGDLSGDDKIAIFHARADIAEYCAVQRGGTSALTDRSVGIFLDGVQTLQRVYREHPDAKVEIPAEKKTLTTQQILREQIAALRKCGRHGRQQAGVLQATLEQEQAKS
jgi:hypothetical protein